MSQSLNLKEDSGTKEKWKKEFLMEKACSPGLTETPTKACSCMVRGTGMGQELMSMVLHMRVNIETINLMEMVIKFLTP